MRCRLEERERKDAGVEIGKGASDAATKSANAICLIYCFNGGRGEFPTPALARPECLPR